MSRSSKKKTEDSALTEAQEVLDVARQIQSQNVTIDDLGQPILSKGVAKDRRISIEDPDMRHGREARRREDSLRRASRFDGYKRHVLRDLESAVVRCVGLTSEDRSRGKITTFYVT
ncbi:MAG: hypothetical protein PUP91_23555 [Rhizonema sp. PD37]|nr:hypothetical protein [Rhizonema sp. PD37]